MLTSGIGIFAIFGVGFLSLIPCSLLLIGGALACMSLQETAKAKA